MNWLGVKSNSDGFGKEVLKVMNEGLIQLWSKDEQVTFGPIPMKKSVRGNSNNFMLRIQRQCRGHSMIRVFRFDSLSTYLLFS
jgi:hypothetical protein